MAAISGESTAGCESASGSLAAASTSSASSAASSPATYASAASAASSMKAHAAISSPRADVTPLGSAPQCIQPRGCPWPLKTLKPACLTRLGSASYFVTDASDAAASPIG